MPEVEFKAPGPGVWELEQTHFAKPATRFIADVFPDALARGFGEGTKRFGLLLDTLRIRMVNDFCYSKACPVGAPDGAKGPPPKPVFQLLMRLHPEIRRRIRDGALAYEKKLWREDMKRWDEEYKPDSIARNSRLQHVKIESLDDAAFVRHLTDVRDNHIEMVYRHHIFTIPSCLPVGHFLAETQRWTGLPSGEVLGLLKGCAPISRGVAVKELDGLRDALQSAGIGANVARGKPAAQVLQQLQDNPAVGDALAGFLDAVGYRMVSGYDVAEKYALEMPDVLVKTMFGSADRDNRGADFETRRDAFRQRVPAANRPQFDELLEEARYVHRLRDERGMYNDLWASGLSRRAILEAGRRLKANGTLPEAELAVYASCPELVTLLNGHKGAPVEELRRRQAWCESKTIADAPPLLGGTPSGPPPEDWLPAKARANARAVDTVLREIFDASARPNTAHAVEGMPVHPGVYEGPARIVKGPEDFDRLQSGDVLVARTTGPAFNVVLPLLGAIVTDRGGQLSHAAIVAREYGIPAVVGTREATVKFTDGARLRVDGNLGVVELLA